MLNLQYNGLAVMFDVEGGGRWYGVSAETRWWKCLQYM